MEKRITLAHGSGGKPMQELIERLRLQFSNKFLDELSDAAVLHGGGPGHQQAVQQDIRLPYLLRKTFLFLLP